jgi:hypothetical protein
MLVGTAVLSAGGSTGSEVDLVVNQGQVTNNFPMRITGGAGAMYLPFNIPLNPGAVYYFTNMSDAGTTASIANAVVIGL